MVGLSPTILLNPAGTRPEPAVSVPSLILQHREDSLAPLAVGEYLHRHLKNSELQVLDVAGHCAHMSLPELVVRAMRAYLH